MNDDTTTEIEIYVASIDIETEAAETAAETASIIADLVS